MCPNCGGASTAAYCSTCGQEQFIDPPTISKWLGDALSELFFVERKLPRTLHLLASPGRLTVEWLSGRRAQFVRPFRLFLASTALALLSMSLDAYVQDYNSIGQNLLNAAFTVVGVPAMAIAARIGFGLRRSWSSLMPHLVFSLHLHAFVFLTLTLAVFLNLIVAIAVGPLPDLAFAVLGPVFLVYLVLAGMRSFDLKATRGMVGAGVTVALYVTMMAPVLWLVSMVAFRRVS
jgi:hypothetical protein